MKKYCFYASFALEDFMDSEKIYESKRNSKKEKECGRATIESPIEKMTTETISRPFDFDFPRVDSRRNIL